LEEDYIGRGITSSLFPNVIIQQLLKFSKKRDDCNDGKLELTNTAKITKNIKYNVVDLLV